MAREEDLTWHLIYSQSGYLEMNQSRLNALANNIERCGISNVAIYRKDAQFAQDLNLKFDKILLDAPCSGNFASDPEWFNKRTIEGIKANVKTQKALLKEALRVLKPGGTVVYSTCSLEPEENEEVIEWAIDNLNIKLAPIDLNIGSDGLTPKTRLCKRIWPDKTQGFFIAKIKV